jgi:anaerobic selenocysteine-containing dehydrogenase
MLESYPGNPSIERILSLDSNNRQKMLTLPLTIENQITELIIPWTEYEPPNYIQLFDEIKNLNFEEYHKWIDNYYKQLLMQNMSDEMKEFVKDLHYNYRWSAWSKTIHDIYDYIKGQYINYNFASDQFKKTENIWTWSIENNAWINSRNSEIRKIISNATYCPNCNAPVPKIKRETNEPKIEKIPMIIIPAFNLMHKQHVASCSTYY